MAACAQIESDEYPFLPNRSGGRRRPVKILRLAGVVTALLLFISRMGAADPIHIFASGTPGPNGQTNGYPLTDGNFVGLDFFVASTVTTGTIGGHLGGLGGVDIFGAIVALSGPADVPDSRDLSTPDVRGAARLILSPSGRPSSSRVISAPLVVSLNPGWYLLVFGSGLFGATGSGLFTLDNFPRIGQTVISSGGLTHPEFGFGSGELRVNRLYAFVDAQSQSTPTPEPSTVLCLGSGLAVLLRRRRRIA
jgi:hypothetical protein